MYVGFVAVRVHAVVVEGDGADGREGHEPDTGFDNPHEAHEWNRALRMVISKMAPEATSPFCSVRIPLVTRRLEGSDASQSSEDVQVKRLQEALSDYSPIAIYILRPLKSASFPTRHPLQPSLIIPSTFDQDETWQ